MREVFGVIGMSWSSSGRHDMQGLKNSKVRVDNLCNFLRMESSVCLGWMMIL